MFESCGKTGRFCGPISEGCNHTGASWNAIISSCASSGNYGNALHVYSRMHHEHCVALDKTTLLCIIKACSNTKAIHYGHHIHNQTFEHGLENDIFIGNALIDMYAKCGSLNDAYTKFVQMPRHSVVSWGAMINAYVHHGQGHSALKLLKWMILENLEEPNKVVYLGGLKACSFIKDIHSGNLLYNNIIEKSLDSDVVIVNSIIDMYAKCEKIEDARKVFDAISCPTVVSWGAMLGGYVNNNLNIIALEFFQNMQEKGMKPNMVIFLSVLKACGSIKALDQGRLVHKQVKSFSKLETVMGNALMDMYVRCGSMKEAHEVFNELATHDSASFDIMISGYSHNKQADLVLDLLQYMNWDGITPNISTFVHALEVCGKLAQGQMVHFLITKDALDSDVVIGTSLICMYQQHGHIQEASKVFENLSTRDVVAWGAMIEAYAESGEGLKALKLLEKMEEQGSHPNTPILLSALKACSSTEIIKKGRIVHNHIVKIGAEQEALVGSSLIHMYVKCGILTEACKTFENLVIKDTVSWSSLILGYAQTVGHGHHALELFEEMLQNQIEVDEGVYLSVMMACANMQAISDGRLIHSYIVCNRIELGVSINGALVDFYTKCGTMDDASRVFGTLPKSSILPWGLMLAGYVQGGHLSSAFELFEQMAKESIELDEAMILSLMKVFSSIGSIKKGNIVHELIVKSSQESNTTLSNALVDMYGKCGSIYEATKVFDNVPCKDAVTWGAMIAAFAQHGHYTKVGEYVEQMQAEGLRPTEIIYINILAACSHGGFLHRGYASFTLMREEHGIRPNIKHYSGMADLLSRVGHLGKAKDLLHSMPNAPDLLGWTSLLTSCKTYGHVSIGTHCHEQVFELDANHDLREIPEETSTKQKDFNSEHIPSLYQSY